MLTATFPNGFRIYACKRAKNSTAFPRISQNIKSCNDSNSVEQLQKMRNVWWTQSNLMRLLVLQMTVNEMLKNPQHLWHFLDLLKSLKTPRKSFLAAEKDNQCASSRTLLSFFPGLFSPPLDSEQILIPFFAAGYLIDPIWGRGGIDEGEWVQSGRPWLRQSVVSSSFDFLAFCRMFPITGPGKGGINKRESSLFAWAFVKICTYLVIPLPRSVSASHNIITSLRDTSGRPNCLSL